MAARTFEQLSAFVEAGSGETFVQLEAHTSFSKFAREISDYWRGHPISAAASKVGARLIGSRVHTLHLRVRRNNENAWQIALAVGHAFEDAPRSTSVPHFCRRR